MARLSRFVTVAVLLGGATVSLSACTGGSDPIASPSPSVSTVVTPSPSVSPSPTPQPSDPLAGLPDFMLGDDPVGAGNFAFYFIANYQTMYDTKDDSLYRLVSGPDCEFCANALASYDTFIAEDQSVVGGAITSSLQMMLGNPQDDGVWLVQFPIDIEPVEYTAADGTVVESVGAKRYDVGVSLRLVNGQWVVLGANLKERP